MKKYALILCLLPYALWAQEVESLRGADSLEAESTLPESKQWTNDDVIVPRQYIQQPPLIPHDIEGYRITINANKCLSCHSWERAAKMKATKVSLTHFKDRDGVEHSEISAGRYFCTQCHVPQKNTQPLIDNKFESAKDVGKE